MTTKDIVTKYTSKNAFVNLKKKTFLPYKTQLCNKKHILGPKNMKLWHKYILTAIKATICPFQNTYVV